MNKAYKIIEKKFLPYIKSEAITLEHESGAKLICLKNDDKNKVFSVSFKTPPQDDTGLFHILEHCVLAGSKKYPVKEPFNELVKGSLYTYLNAMTFSDKTMYPIASCNDKDFYILMEVYLDSVFFPRIYEVKETFLQEGWHHSILDRKDDIAYNGIVYNEMKGAYSDPLRVIDNLTNKYLFSETTYRFDSGGNPENIPDLDYKDFLKAHKKYYHPSNSYIYLYGDMDIEKSLELIHNDYLSKFLKQDYSENIEMQKQSPIQTVKFVEGEYSVESQSDMKQKNILSANYIVDDYVDAQKYYDYKLLAHILFGTSASPVKKALIEKNICQEVIGVSSSSMLETVLSITAKNSDKELIEFKKIIDDILIELVEKGIDKNLINSSINKFEFIFSEEDYGYTPKGLFYNITILSSWLHGGNGFEKLDYLKAINFIKEKIKSESYFENIIKDKLINNNNCVYTIVKPKKELNKLNEKAIAKRLKEFKGKLSETELDNLIKQTNDLKEYQNTKDTEENLAKIPFLELSDISNEPEKIPFDIDRTNECELYHTNLDTNSIIYANIMFNTDKIEADKLYIIGLLSYLLGKLSTKKKSYESLSNEMNDFLGGFSVDFDCHNSILEFEKYSSNLFLKIKYIEKNSNKAFGLVNEIANLTLFDDKKRIKNILVELKSKMQNIFLTSGHIFALSRAEAYLSESGNYKDSVKGVAFFEKLKYILENFDDVADGLIVDLKDVSNKIFCKENFSIHITSDQKGFDLAKESINTFFGKLSDEKFEGKQTIKFSGEKNEAFVSSGKIMFNTCVGKIVGQEEGGNGHLRLLSNIISNTYFMDEIRLKGGAYGFGANITGNNVFKFHSYRDPNVKKTYETYNKVAQFIGDFDATEIEMKKLKLGTINGLDRYLLPSKKGALQLRRFLSDKTYDMQVCERIEILSAKIQDLRKYAQVFESSLKESFICSFGDSSKISEDADVFDAIKNIE